MKSVVNSQDINWLYIFCLKEKKTPVPYIAFQSLISAWCRFVQKSDGAGGGGGGDGAGSHLFFLEPTDSL